METRTNARADARTAPLRAALDWRLLVAWTATMLLPTLIVARPLARALGDLVDHLPPPLADKLGGVVLLDSFFQLVPSVEALRGAFFVAGMVSLLLSPFLAGLAVAAYAERPTSYFGLVGAAAASYGRLFRLMLVSLIPYGIAIGLITMVYALGNKHVEKAVLESASTTTSRLAMIVSLILLLLAQLTVETARAELAADSGLRSALRAWVRGVKLVAKRPGATLGRFLLPTLLSLVVAFIFTCVRIRVAFVPAAFVLTQLAVATIGWGRAARIFALAPLTKS